MKLELDEIKSLAEQEDLGAITLDTCIFDAQGLQLESGLLKRLSQFRHRPTKFILSQIVKNEVITHLKEEAKKSKNETEKAFKSIKRYWQIEENEIDSIKKTIFKNLEPEKIASDRFDKFVELTSLELVEAQENIKINELIERYFQSQPPFADTGKKKTEFPDAIALMSLESWAKKKDTKMVVVTMDNDWIKFCENSKYLLVVNELPLALSLFQNQLYDYDADYICSYLSKKYDEDNLKDIVEVTESRLQNLINDVDFYPEAYSNFCYSDEIEASYEGFEFRVFEKPNIIFRAIDYDSESIVVEAELIVTINIEVNFSFYVKDFIDKDYVSLADDSVATRVSLDANILVTLVANSDNTEEEFQVEDIEVNLSTTSKAIDFGQVEPHWMHEDEDYFFK